MVTALLQFFRSIGNTVGTAIFGSILTLRFVPEVRSSLSDDLSEALPEQAIVLALSPQALVDPNQADSLRPAIADTLPSSPEPSSWCSPPCAAGFAGSLHWVFLSAAVVFASGMVATLFLREVPLAGERKRLALPRRPPISPEAAAQTPRQRWPRRRERSTSLHVRVPPAVLFERARRRDAGAERGRHLDRGEAAVWAARATMRTCAASSTATRSTIRGPTRGRASNRSRRRAPGHRNPPTSTDGST